jgi:hypothetical protein
VSEVADGVRGEGGKQEVVQRWVRDTREGECRVGRRRNGASENGRKPAGQLIELAMALKSRDSRYSKSISKQSIGSAFIPAQFGEKQRLL